jgi:ribonucleoside-diphosphate reductase beta chain
MIARDEALHLTGTQHILNLWKSGSDDPEMAEISEQLADQGKQIFLDVVEQEKEWADYLFKDGSMIGMNKEIICQYIEYIANQRLGAIGFEPAYDVLRNPLPWMNSWLVSDNVQVAPQESEITSYLVGAIDSEVSHEDFSDIEL